MRKMQKKETRRKKRKPNDIKTGIIKTEKKIWREEREKKTIEERRTREEEKYIKK